MKSSSPPAHYLPRRTLPLAIALATLACNGGGGSGGGSKPQPSLATGTAFAVTESGRLISFDVTAPGQLRTTQLINGLAAGETVLGADIRPHSEKLFVLGSTGRVYRVDGKTANAIFVVGPISPALSGSSFGFEVDPVADQMRITSDLDQNLSLGFQSATAATDANLAYDVGDPNFGADPEVVALAHSNAFDAAAATTLYGIDTTLDVLVRVGSVDGSPQPPDSGLLTTIGALGVDASSAAAFDIVGGGTAIAALAAPGAVDSQIYSIDLASGAATLIGTVGAGEVIVAIAVDAPTFHGLNTAGKLVTFSGFRPAVLKTVREVDGLQAGEELVAIDFRPGTGQLMGVGSASRLYLIDPASGDATEVGIGPFAPALAGADFGIDFDPRIDRLRVVSNTDENLVINPSTGAVQSVDSPLAYEASDPNVGIDPSVIALANSDVAPSASSTTAYGIDSGLDILVRLGSPGGSPSAPASGELFTIGALGFDAPSMVGLDIALSGAAYAAFSLPGSNDSVLFWVDLSSGAATEVGRVGVNFPLRSIAIPLPVSPTAYAVTSANELIRFKAFIPGTIQVTNPISGLMTGETIIGLDFRPEDGTLFGVGSLSHLYEIDPDNGDATEVGSGGFNPALLGTEFGVDFNPTSDNLRIVSDADQNLRVDSDSGNVIQDDTPLAYDPADPNAGADPEVVAIGHTSNFQGANVSTLFGVDSALDILVRIGGPDGVPSPDGGLLFTIGALGVDTSTLAAMDVASGSGAFAALTAPAGTSSDLYRVDLATGVVSLIGTIGGGATVRALALDFD
jgi:hypothetical protein